MEALAQQCPGFKSLTWSGPLCGSEASSSVFSSCTCRVLRTWRCCVCLWGVKPSRVLWHWRELDLRPFAQCLLLYCIWSLLLGVFKLTLLVEIPLVLFRALVHRDHVEVFQKNGFDFVEGADGRLALAAVPFSQKVLHPQCAWSTPLWHSFVSAMSDLNCGRATLCPVWQCRRCCRMRCALPGSSHTCQGKALLLCLTADHLWSSRCKGTAGTPGGGPWCGNGGWLRKSARGGHHLRRGAPLPVSSIAVTVSRTTLASDTSCNPAGAPLAHVEPTSLVASFDYC